MPALTLTTDAIVLLRRPSTSDSFQTYTVFSAGQGTLLVMQRMQKKANAGSAPLDLFSEAAVFLESSNQGQTWFVKEARVLRDAAGIGRDYEALRHASDFAALVARNIVPEESRARVYALLQQAFAAFAGGPRPDIAYLKSLYCFARDEGYAVKQQWFPALAHADREMVAALLNKPLAGQTAAPVDVARVRDRLEVYLRAHTEILTD